MIDLTNLDVVGNVAGGGSKSGFTFVSNKIILSFNTFILVLLSGWLGSGPDFKRYLRVHRPKIE